MRELKPSKVADLSLDKAIRLAHEGDARAFEFIYRRYCGYVHSICLRMLRNPAEAEDAAQDVFVRVLCKIHTFRGEAAFSSWLYRLTTNLILMRFRKNHHRWMPLEEYKEDDSGSYSRISPPNGHPRDLLDRIDLQAAIDALPDGYKTAFILHEVRGYRHREIAAIFGYSVGNSKSQLHGARKHLRSLLGDAPEERAGQGTKLKSVCLSGNC